MNRSNEMLVIDQQQPHKIKGGITAMVAIGLLLVISIGGTFAFLKVSGNQTPNRFTGREFLTCDLLEPAWTNAALTDNGVAVTATSSTTVDNTKVKYYDYVDNIAIPKGAAKQVPGSEFKKNPFVVNTSTQSGSGEGEELQDPDDQITGYGFAAMKITFQRVNSSGKYQAMTDAEIQKLFACYYFGNVETTTSGTGADATTTQSLPTTDTKAGWGGEDNDKLGAGWYQLTGSKYNGATANHADSTGSMYFMNTTRLEPIGKTLNKTYTKRPSISTTAGKVTETASSDTWGYDADNSSYATTPLFQAVRYVDKAEQADIAALKNMLDEDGAVSEAGKTPGWRMIISCAMISSDSDDDLDVVCAKDGDGTVTGIKQSGDYYDNFKTALDAAMTTSKKEASGSRVTAATKLGAYITKGTSSSTVTNGTGVAEVYVPSS